MVELQLPKLLTWVRFPSPAPLLCRCQATNVAGDAFITPGSVWFVPADSHMSRCSLAARRPGEVRATLSVRTTGREGGTLGACLTHYSGLPNQHETACAASSRLGAPSLAQATTPSGRTSTALRLKRGLASYQATRTSAPPPCLLRKRVWMSARVVPLSATWCAGRSLRSCGRARRGCRRKRHVTPRSCCCS